MKYRLNIRFFLLLSATWTVGDAKEVVKEGLKKEPMGEEILQEEECIPPTTWVRRAMRHVMSYGILISLYAYYVRRISFYGILLIVEGWLRLMIIVLYAQKLSWTQGYLYLWK